MVESLLLIEIEKEEDAKGEGLDWSNVGSSPEELLRSSTNTSRSNNWSIFKQVSLNLCKKNCGLQYSTFGSWSFFPHSKLHLQGLIHLCQFAMTGMACSMQWRPHAESLQVGSFSHWTRTRLSKRSPRPYSYTESVSVEAYSIQKLVDTPFGKLISDRAKGSFFGNSAHDSFSLLALGNGRCQREAKKRPIVSASSTSFGESAAGNTTSVGTISLSKKDLKIAVGAAIAILFTVANKVLYKLALIPMKDYPFFMALINTIGYVLVYFSILYVRRQAGLVTDEMLELPKLHFIQVGFLEALGIAAGMAAAAVLPGASIPILIQTFLPWQLVLSMAFLKKRYTVGQIVGCIMVFSGIILALASTGNGLGSSAGQISLFWPLLMILSCAFQASASIIKEFVFRDSSQCLKGGSVDIFVVNSFGSLYQVFFVLLMLPFLSQLRGVPFNKLAGYMKDGAGCLFNIGTRSIDCNGATLLTFSYVMVNLGFNISVLSLLKMSSAVVSSLCMALAVPLSIFVFTLPLPYIGAPSSLTPQFLTGTAVLLSGLALYNFSGHVKRFSKNDLDRN